MIVVEQTERDRARLNAASVDAAAIADDHFDYSGKVVRKPWGCEREAHRGAEYSAWVLDIDAGGETSMHCHPNKVTFLIVNIGEVEFETLDRASIFRAGAVILIERGVFHRTKALMSSQLTEIEMPPNKNDLVRIEDRYGREGTRYETPEVRP